MIIVRNDNLYLKNDNHLECNLNMHGHVTDIYLTKVHKTGLAKRHNQKADATDSTIRLRLSKSSLSTKKMGAEHQDACQNTKLGKK